MKADTTITVTPALIEDWEKQARDCDNQAAKLQQDAKNYRARADAGRLLLGLAGDATAFHGKVTLLPVADLKAKPDDGAQNMTADIRKMANESPEPLAKKEVKRRLLAAGYPKSRLGAYFYTPIHRLKEAKQITVLPDGRIWRAGAA